MVEKVKSILGSVRFYQVLVAGVVAYLGSTGVLDPAVVKLVTSVLGVSVVIGTVDKAAKNIGNK